MASFFADFFSFWRDLLAALGRGWEAVEKLQISRRFGRFVRVFGAVTVGLLVVYWVLSLAGLQTWAGWVLVLISLELTLLGSLAVSVGAVIYDLGQRVPGVRLAAQVTAAVCLGALFVIFALYNLPHSLPVVLIVMGGSVFVALMVVRFGIGPSPKRAYWVFGVVFLLALTRASLATVLPETFAAAGTAVVGADSFLARWLANSTSADASPIRIETVEEFRATRFFDAQTAIVFYSRTADGGFDLYDGPGLNPQTGVRLQSVDSMVQREILQWVEREEAARLAARPHPAPNRISRSVDSVEFFDRASGASLVWYSLLSDGQVDLFDGPGIHPISGAELKPVDAAAVEMIRATITEGEKTKSAEARADSLDAARAGAAERAAAQRIAERNRRARYMNSACDGSAVPGVLVLVDGRLSISVSQALADRIGGRTDCIAEAFVGDGLFTKALRGDPTEAQSLLAGTTAILAELVNSETSVAPAGESMVKVTTLVTARVLAGGSRTKADGISARTQGVGFTSATAHDAAVSAAIDSLTARLRIVLSRGPTSPDS
jgi:hypothetical protein